LKIFNKEYRDILVLNNSGQGIEKYSSMYYAKNIGLVKFVETRNGKVWELLRYKIIQ